MLAPSPAALVGSPAAVGAVWTVLGAWWSSRSRSRPPRPRSWSSWPGSWLVRNPARRPRPAQPWRNRPCRYRAACCRRAPCPPRCPLQGPRGAQAGPPGRVCLSPGPRCPCRRAGRRRELASRVSCTWSSWWGSMPMASDSQPPGSKRSSSPGSGALVSSCAGLVFVLGPSRWPCKRMLEAQSCPLAAVLACPGHLVPGAAPGAGAGRGARNLGAGSWGEEPGSWCAGRGAGETDGGARLVDRGSWMEDSRTRIARAAWAAKGGCGGAGLRCPIRDSA